MSRRPRGYIDWQPQAKTQALLAQVEAVLSEYRAHLPMTVRQVFYRLVGHYGYPKDERAYGRLQETLVKARRAEIIAFESIRDDNLVSRAPRPYEDKAQFVGTLKAAANSFALDRQRDQAQRLEMWCEAAGMVPQLWRGTAGYGVPVYSSSGFDGVTLKWQLAQRAVEVTATEERPLVVLHIGDRDPSGHSIFDSLSEDVDEFAAADGGEVYFERVAVTAQQVRRYGLPGAPPKASDKRGAWSGATYQAEALAPTQLADEVRRALEARTDEELRQAVLAEQTQIRGELDAMLSRLEPEEGAT